MPADEPVIIRDGSPLRIEWEDLDTSWDGTALHKPCGRPVTKVKINGTKIDYARGTALTLWVTYKVGNESHALLAYTDANGDRLAIIPASDPTAPGFPFDPAGKVSHSADRNTRHHVNAVITSTQKRADKHLRKWDKKARSGHTTVVISCARSKKVTAI